MPNHCNNQLTLANEQNLLSVLNPYLTFKGEDDYDFDFQKIIPMDEELLKGEDWYSWRVENWGTKWEGYDGRFSYDRTAFSFETAWSPPIPVIKKLAELTGGTFVLQYIEEGCDFCGRYVVGPNVEREEHYDGIENAPQELKEALCYEPYEEEDMDAV